MLGAPAHHVQAALPLLRQSGVGGRRGGGRRGGPKGDVLDGDGGGAVDHGLGGDPVHTLACRRRSVDYLER